MQLLIWEKNFNFGLYTLPFASIWEREFFRLSLSNTTIIFVKLKIFFKFWLSFFLVIDYPVPIQIIFQAS